MVLKTMRPVYSLVSYASKTAVQQQSGKGLVAEAETNGQLDQGKGAKGKGQRGFLGCGCRQGIPTSDTPPQPQTKTLNPSTSAKCLQHKLVRQNGINQVGKVIKRDIVRGQGEWALMAKSARDRCEIDMCVNKSDNTSAEAKLKPGHVKCG